MCAEMSGGGPQEVGHSLVVVVVAEVFFTSVEEDHWGWGQDLAAGLEMN